MGPLCVDKTVEREQQGRGQETTHGKDVAQKHVRDAMRRQYTQITLETACARRSTRRATHLLLAAPSSPAPPFPSSQALTRDAHGPCARRSRADAPPCCRHRRPCLGRPRRKNQHGSARHAHATTPNVHLEPRRIVRVEAQRQATRGAPPVGRRRRAAAATARRRAAAAPRRCRAGGVGTAPDARGHVPTSRRLQENTA